MHLVTIGGMDARLAQIVERATTLHSAIAADLSGFGGILRCTECGWTRPLGDVACRLRSGWPECCGYTMTWVTQRELDEEKASG
jgi:hypothetical protein